MAGFNAETGEKIWKNSAKPVRGRVQSKTPKNPLNPSCVEFFLMHLSKRFHDTQVVVVNINVVKRCHVKQTRVVVFVGITQ